MRWVAVLREDELGQGSRREVQVEGRTVLLAHEQGRVYAFAPRCPHMGAPLMEAAIGEDGILTCPRHHSRFDLATGEPVAWSPWPPVLGSVFRAVRRERPLAVYPVLVGDGVICVGFPDEQGAA
ncbi:MAG: Rieske (2Fe-2S) protein [Anaerolineae bacterium]|nr:Rieske (2Fe-2S) protein [Anaerolineae bacterium]